MGKLNSTLRDTSNLKGANKPIKFDLQFFTDGEGVNRGEQNNQEEQGGQQGEGGGDTNTEPRTYTQDELDKLLQAESDRRVTSAREKFEKEFKEKLETEKLEAERLSKLTADEKEKELLKKQKAELEEKEKAIKYRELQLDTVNALADEKLPVGFANFLIKGDAETTNENIKKFKEEWQTAIAAAVDEKIKGTSPRNNGGTNAAGTGLGKRLAEQRQKAEEAIKENPYF